MESSETVRIQRLDTNPDLPLPTRATSTPCTRAVSSATLR